MPEVQKSNQRRFTLLGDLAAAKKKRVTFADATQHKASNDDSALVGWKQLAILIVATIISYSLPAHLFMVHDPKILLLARSVLNSVIYYIAVNKQLPIDISFTFKR